MTTKTPGMNAAVLAHLRKLTTEVFPEDGAWDAVRHAYRTLEDISAGAHAQGRHDGLPGVIIAAALSDTGRRRGGTGYSDGMSAYEVQGRQIMVALCDSGYDAVDVVEALQREEQRWNEGYAASMQEERQFEDRGTAVRQLQLADEKLNAMRQRV